MQPSMNHAMERDIHFYNVLVSNNFVPEILCPCLNLNLHKNKNKCDYTCNTPQAHKNPTACPVAVIVVVNHTLHTDLF